MILSLISNSRGRPVVSSYLKAPWAGSFDKKIVCNIPQRSVWTTFVAKAAPAARTVVRGGFRIVVFYGGWRGCEKAEEVVHSMSGGRTEFLRARPVTPASRVISEYASEGLAQTTSTSAGTGTGTTTMASPSEDYFLMISDNRFFMLLLLGFCLVVVAYIVSIINPTYKTYIKKIGGDILTFTSLSIFAWSITKYIADCVEKLEGENILAIQSVLENSNVQFLIGAVIAGVIGLISRWLLQWYRGRKAS